MAIVYAGFAATFGVNGYLTRHLDLDGLGDFRVAISIASIAAAIVIFGGQAAAGRFIPQYLSTEQWGKAKGFIKHYLKIALMLGGAATVVSLLAASAFDYFGMRHLMHESLFAIVITPIIAVSLFFGSIIQSMHRPVSAILPSELLKPVLFLLGCILWLQIFPTFNDFEVIFIFFVVNLVVVTMQYYLLSHALPFPFVGTAPVYDTSTWHKVSLPLLYSVMANSFMVRIDVLALEIMHASEHEVGVFILLAFICSPVWMTFTSMNNVISPKIAELDGDKAGLKRLFGNSFKFLILSNLAVAALIIVFADLILNWFHGDLPTYKNWLYVLLAGSVVNCAIEVASPFLRFGGHQDKSAKVASIALMANLVVTPLGILLYGMEGAIIALVVMRFARCMGYMYYARKYVLRA